MTAGHIHVQVDDMPPDSAEPVVMALELALKFCAQPETFPVFTAFVQAESAGFADIAEVLATLTPEILQSIRGGLIHGFAADSGFEL